MNQVRQEYQLISILAEQLKQEKPNTPEWWLKDEKNLEIVKKMHDIIKNFKYEPPVEQNNYKRNISSIPQKKKINFQVR